VATVERILEASTRVLVERGLQQFNTNVIAEEAGVNVGTLYHYFADKNAVLRELFDRDQAARTAYFSDHVEAALESDELEQRIHGLISALVEFRRRSPGTVVLRRACRAVPELIEAEIAANEVLASALDAALRHRLPDLPAVRSTAAARTLIEVGRALLDQAGEQIADAAVLQHEFEVLIVSYLRQLEDANAAAGSAGSAGSAGPTNR
jgi:AcrR family transcriptional regulator